MLDAVNNKRVDGWEELYASFYPSLCAYCRRITTRADIAEDIVQDLLVKLWHSSRRFDSMAELTFFLYKSCYNNSLNWLRTSKLHAEKLAAMEQNFDDEAFAATIREELLRRLHCAIERLPEQRRRIIVLSLSGHSRDEIAEILSISPNTVKAQKTVALKSLRSRLKNSPLVFFL